MPKKRTIPTWQQPLLLEACCQTAIWGGQSLRQHYGKKAPAAWPNVAESWELSTHAHGQNKIANTPYDGQTMSDYLTQAGPSCLGTGCVDTRLPILIKYIDAASDLSVQVHPDDDYARRYENSASKTEMWYVVAAQPGASIYYGIQHPVTKEELVRHIQQQTLTDILRRVSVQAGDSFLIPAGTIHAIGQGLLIAEIQQSSDITYRVYDYGRRGSDGQPRELHIDQALAVANLQPVPSSQWPIVKVKTDTLQVTELARHPDFVVNQIRYQGDLHWSVDSDSYQVLLMIDGQTELVWRKQRYPLALLQTVFLPAGLGHCQLRGHGTVLVVHSQTGHFSPSASQP